MTGTHTSHAIVHRFYGEHQPWLLHRLHSRVRHREDAEDLTAETFLQVMQQRDLADIREPRAFLTTLAKRILFHFWRRRDLEQAYLDALSLQPATQALSAEEHNDLVETLLRVDHALDGLPSKAKTAFLYSQIDGLTHKEIAARLGLSTMTVRRHIARAVERCCALA
ncbi:sigma-70 family RNA polymerase sigma factor [Dyella sp. C11]|uniref:sigma-70 family RNA polymerase sigma factor n=1 Tax=Dyella sp. C11 TaxID=2126991 RepID=UPI000D64D98D|nr:sigma-70 family RNA polymerase sigma factor [Dyella sp. C11]